MSAKKEKTKIDMKGNLFHDRYFKERLLGRGNFSEVWMAMDIKTDIEVALKIYAPATGLDSHGVNVLSREFAIVANANHRNLLKPSHYDVVDNKPYLVLPYCKKGSIQRLIGQFTEEQAWHLIHDVASALAYLHSREPVIIHQDIKPDNIMMDDGGDYMISDFGISSHAKSTLRKSLSIAFSSAGTTAYMAPERFEADNTPIKANDIWSLGAMVYEMLDGDVPFTAGGIEGGILQKQGAEIPLLSDKFSPALRHVVDLCLQREPWNRPTAAQLEQYAQVALAGGNPFVTPRSTRKRVIFFATITTLLVIAIGFIPIIHRCSNSMDEEFERHRLEELSRMRRSAHDHMSNAEEALAEGMNYDNESCGDKLIIAFKEFDYALEIASPIDSLLDDTIRQRQRVVRSELIAASERFWDKYKQFNDANYMTEADMFKSRAERVDAFIRERHLTDYNTEYKKVKKE